MLDFLKKYVDTKELRKTIKESKKTIEAKELEILHLNFVVEKLGKALTDKTKEYDDLVKNTEIIEGHEIAESLAFPFDLFSKDLSQLSINIAILEQDVSRAMKLGSAKNIITAYRVDGSSAKGQKMQNSYIDNMFIGFNTYFGKKLKAVSESNYTDTRGLIIRNFEKANKRGENIGVGISENYLELCLKLLDATLAYKVAKKEEKEREKEEKRRLKEEEQLVVDAEKAKKKIQAERRMYEQNLAKDLTEEERKEFESKLKELDKRESDIDYRLENNRAGYLYVTATPAMPGITKLGCTRRLNPLARIAELSSASVPFPFVCYGLVFSDDVFELETKIHTYFDNKRTNKENKHKEFFNISPKEAVDVLEKNFQQKVHYTFDFDEE